MKTLILKIDKPGLTLDICGQLARTPFSMDISSKDINKVVMELRKSGIDEYNITSVPSKPEKIEPRKETESVVVELKQRTDNIDALNKRFDKLEKLLTNVVSQASTPVIVDTKTKFVEKKKGDPEIEELFIPEANTEGLTISTTSTREMEIDGDISDQVELLRFVGNSIKNLKNGGTSGER